jgi:hypothetical protein
MRPFRPAHHGARAALALVLLAAGCAYSEPGCTVDLNRCSSDGDCPAGLRLFYEGPAPCRVDVCREGACTTEPVTDGTTYEPRPSLLGLPPPGPDPCTQQVCVQGEVTVEENPANRPLDTDCARFTCQGKELVTEFSPACLMLDASPEDADDVRDVTDVEFDAESDSSPDSEVGDAFDLDAVEATSD